MNLTPEFIMQEIEAHKSKRAEIKKYRDFADGKLEILNKKDKGNGMASSKAVINFAAKMKNNIVGYMHSIPFKITHKTDPVLQEFLDELFTYNDKGYLNIETGAGMTDVGSIYWMTHIDKYGYLIATPIIAEEVILIKNGSYLNNVDVAIRYFMREDLDKKEDVLYVEVYTENEIYYYIDSKDGLIMDYSKAVNPVRNLFRHVPFAEFSNIDNTSDYRDIYDLVNLYVEMFNAGADEVLDIRETFLKFINTNITDKGIKASLDARAFILDSSKDYPADVQFMSKNANNESFENYLALVRSLIFEMACMPDTKTLTQKTGEMSGKAMKQLMRELENKCAIKEANMVKGIQNFLIIIKEYVWLKTGIDYKLSDFDIQFIRNEPSTLTLETMDDFVKLKSTGLIDRITMRTYLPFVRDSQNLEDKLQEQNNKDMGIGMDYSSLHKEEL